MKTIKPLKGLKNSHTSNSKIGSGDSYGTGVKQKVGTIKRDFMNSKPLSAKKLGKPPRSLA